MARLFSLPGTLPRHPAVEAWFASRPPALGALALAPFARMRACGPDVREILHDGMPTACVGDQAFAYVACFRAHVNVGFFAGAELPDPAGLLEGTGRFMRHVKLRPGALVDEAALTALIDAAYTQLRG